MALILNIDTATEYASVCLSSDGTCLALETNPSQKDHAAFIQPAISKILKDTGKEIGQVDAVAVSNGPGSYTGLRVGLSTAKGLCYAIGKPLVLINTLEIMASAAIAAIKNGPPAIILPVLFCPMIDARRMEVFTAAYSATLEIRSAPEAMILDETSFGGLLEQHAMVFSGNGSMKLANICTHHNAIFLKLQHDARHMQTIAENLYLLKSFADLAYSEPFYLKEFFTPPQKLKTDIKTS
ncbi:MAG: tsaB [Chitinophagaceae bacterium]|jgi:tRNA threonylcarbamoyladenosine biosynthesis protein TsaB|nr:tsaB [Chitinophagaceae bacterium]